MKIETIGSVFLNEDGMELSDFTFALDEGEAGYPEPQLKQLATLLVLRWAVERILAEVDLLNQVPAQKEFH